MEPVILEAPGDSERPPLRWRAVSYARYIMQADEGVVGLLVYGPPEWALLVYLGRWVIGIERTREEDD